MPGSTPMLALPRRSRRCSWLRRQVPKWNLMRSNFMTIQWSGRGPELLLRLGRGCGQPLRSQLEAGLRDAIRSGRLQAGERLPSSRELARCRGWCWPTRRQRVLRPHAAVSGPTGGGSRICSMLLPAVSRPGPQSVSSRGTYVSRTATTILPGRVRACWARNASASLESPKMAETTGRSWPASISRASCRSCSPLGSTTK